MKRLLIPLLAALALPVQSGPYGTNNRTVDINQGSYRTAKVNGSKDTVYATWQKCWFDEDTRALLGHCFLETVIYNCKTKLITYVGWEGDNTMQNFKFERGDEGDQACRKHFNF